jgi:predicted nucleic acid-binding protein
MWYIDSSAILKLIKLEKESAALIKKLPNTLIASRISRVEVTRTIIRYEPDLLDSTYDVLADIQMVPVEDSIITIAENLPQFINLRSLDSLHIASALAIKNVLKGIITYDKEMVIAANALGFKTLSPGTKL